MCVCAHAHGDSCLFLGGQVCQEEDMQNANLSYWDITTWGQHSLSLGNLLSSTQKGSNGQAVRGEGRGGQGGRCGA